MQESTDALLRQLSYGDLYRSFAEADKARLRALQVVGEDSGWLIDFWCGKNIRELIQMPFSWHWMMHIEESLRVKNIVCPAERRKADGG